MTRFAHVSGICVTVVCVVHFCEMDLITIVWSTVIQFCYLITMSSLKSTSKAVGRLITTKNSGMRLRRLQNNLEPEHCVQSRCFRNICNVEASPSSRQVVGGSHKDYPFSLQNMSPSFLTQRRRFLGCGDGDEGSNGLSKIHEENRIMG